MIIGQNDLITTELCTTLFSEIEVVIDILEVCRMVVMVSLYGIVSIADHQFERAVLLGPGDRS